MNVSLTPDLERFIREKVDSGLYRSASEVVREGVRLLVARDRDGVRESEAGHAGEEGSLRVAERSAADYAVASESVSMNAAAAKFRQALEMLHLSYALMEQNLRRLDPEASGGDIRRRLTAWKSEADWGEEAPGYVERSADRLAKLRRAD